MTNQLPKHTDEQRAMSQCDFACELASCSHSACDAVVAVVPASSTAAAHCRNAGAPLPLRASCVQSICVFVVVRLIRPLRLPTHMLMIDNLP